MQILKGLSTNERNKNNFNFNNRTCNTKRFNRSDYYTKTAYAQNYSARKHYL